MTERTRPSTDASLANISTFARARGLLRISLALAALVLFVGPAAAAGPGEAFCGTDMAKTIQNIFTLIQFGGPLVGGVLALGATVALPFVRRSDWKKEMKGIRNQGLLWGVIVVALMTELMLFVLIALIYLVRQLVLYLFVLMMPLLIVLWIPGVGPFMLTGYASSYTQAETSMSQRWISKKRSTRHSRCTTCRVVKRQRRLAERPLCFRTDANLAPVFPRLPCEQCIR